jgi:hypothetical protein
MLNRSGGADRRSLLSHHVQKYRSIFVTEVGAQWLEVLGETAPDDQPLGLDGGWDRAKGSRAARKGSGIV